MEQRKTVKIRHPETGQYCTLADYCNALSDHWQTPLLQRDTLSIREVSDPKEAHKCLSEARTVLLEIERRIDLIRGLGLPRRNGYSSRGITIRQDGSWYGVQSSDNDTDDTILTIVLNTQRALLADMERLAALWHVTEYTVTD